MAPFFSLPRSACFSFPCFAWERTLATLRVAARKSSRAAGHPRSGQARRLNGILPVIALLIAPVSALAADPSPTLVFSCAANNDLYVAVSAAGKSYARVDAPRAAVETAPEGAGVLILADGYPQKTTPLDATVFDLAARKRLRLYVEFPSSLPQMTLGPPRQVEWERAVVASDAFGPALAKMRILAIHSCHFLPVQAEASHLVIARVAGFDRAVFGLPKETFPILFEHPRGDLLVATTKLSQFVTARYGPTDAWQAVWRTVFTWLRPGQPVPALSWTAAVRPTFGREEPLPEGAARQAIRRGVHWYQQAHLLVPVPAGKEAKQPAGAAPGGSSASAQADGRFGIMEGHSSRILLDGSQPVQGALRADCNSESALGLAMHGLVDRDLQSRQIAANLLDFVYYESNLQGGPRADPASPSYGLLGWNTSAECCGTYYGDDNAKAMLATMGVAAALESDRWDEPLLRCLLGNFRTSGLLGFRSGALNERDLQRLGWQHFAQRRFINRSPHFESWLWACYLWLYDKTKFEPLLARARTGIRLMMEGYPQQWQWVNGQEQIERARMLLPLAWLLRVEDKPEYRAWLRRIADDFLAHQDASGAIQERLAWALKSNEQYGTCEISLLQENGDPVADMLYVCNFALLGLTEAAAATGEAKLAEAGDRLAEFLVRIQVRSESHPELDGAWFRGFDFRRWEYWASNGDAGWGAWCTETGWTQGWITGVLAIRQQKTTLWDLTAKSRIGVHFDKYRKSMLAPEAYTRTVSAVQRRHAALDKPVMLTAQPDPRYPGLGAISLTDGQLGQPDSLAGEWLGFEGPDLEATIDLGEPIPVRRLAGDFLQWVAMGIFLPREVVFSVSDDGKTFRPVATVANETPANQSGQFTKTLSAELKDVTARYVRVRAKNLATIPDWHPARGRGAWLFVDEILVNPAEGKQ